ncbi:TlpA family protein disulfide reductase [Aliikangiella sp. IMCC44359]|uniref:TlpA family protein disulfide reductase n=1 Tax=Aliikangiella sp. IMCC44359 TaxID=3459125 RepID=UPI00403B24BD
MRLLILFVIIIIGNLPTKATDTIDLSQYEGKVVYLDFWASWCIPCRKSFPWMNQMQKKYGQDKLAIIAVNLDKKHELAQDFLKKYPAEFEVLYDQAGVLAKKYQIPGMPSSIIFDHNGKVVSAHSGFFSKKRDEYELQLQSVINKIPQK